MFLSDAINKSGFELPKKLKILGLPQRTQQRPQVSRRYCAYLNRKSSKGIPKK